MDRVEVRRRLRVVLSDISLTIHAGEVWAITGGNGSGKTTLGRLIAGAEEPWRGTVTHKATQSGLVSFERVEEELQRDRRADLSGIMHGATDPGRTPIELLPPDLRDRLADPTSEESRLITSLRISHILHRGIRFLSTGEIRKALLAAELSRDPDLLVLDDPYDGLDQASRIEVTELLSRVPDRDRALVVITGRAREVPPGTTHVAYLDGGNMVFCGTIAEWNERDVAHASTRTQTRTEGDLAVARDAGDPHGLTTPQSETGADETDGGSTELISMSGVRVAYVSTNVLRDISWSVNSGERWIIHGPNGSGKSTLLGLVTGSNPKVYAQDVSVFGVRRGSGESVWDIQRRMGFVSGDLHLRYPDRVSLRDVVLSGLFDSIGLYEEPSGFDVERAREQLAALGLSAFERHRLRDVSFGMQRLALIGRAVIKRPTILVADEPCQGLDDAHTSMVLEALDRIEVPALLYVTHDPEEDLSSLTHEMQLVPGSGGSTARISRRVRP